MKQVDILGRGFSARSYEPSGGDVFTINAMQFGYAKKFEQQPTKAFWMDHWEDIASYAPGWWEYLCKQKSPIINPAKHLDHNWIIEYPIKEYITHLLFKFPMIKFEYINNTTAYAMVAAICGDYDIIHLHGIDFSTDNLKREGERACTEYWIAIAHAMDICVIVNEESHLLDTSPGNREPGTKWPLYGYKVQPDIDQIIAGELE